MTNLFHDFEALAQNCDAARQLISWRPPTWKKALPDFEYLIDDLSGRADSHTAGIQRSAIYEYASKATSSGATTVAAREAFVVTMIWGRGLDNRGPALTSRMMAKDKFDEALLQIVQVSSDPESGPDERFLSLFSHGRSRIPGLGVSFGTKVIHALGDQVGTPPPLVYDYLVRTALVALKRSGASEIPDAPSPWRFMRSRAYSEYCSWAAKSAARLAVEPRDVEYALFLLGQRLAAAGTGVS